MKNNIMISLIVLIVFIISSVAASAVSYYASPSGAGDGSSESSPFKVTDFISLATPGDTLYLLDGTYKNVDSMVEIRHKNGAQDKPITIKKSWWARFNHWLNS